MQNKMQWMLFLLVTCFISFGHSYFTSVKNFVMDKLSFESCNDYFISSDFTQLYTNLNSKLFGQQIVIDKVFPILKSHFTHDPKKPLVICIHGWTGCGKNYLTRIIVDTLYKNKFDSKFVHQFNGRLHFPLDSKKHIDEYRLNLIEWIKGNVTNCARSLFIFDEVDKMPQGVLDAIKPFLDYYDKIDFINYRKAIFIFISNKGAQEINSQYTYLWRSGKFRSDMLYKDFEPLLRNALYNSKGAFQSSEILDSHLVTLYLPFLPLQEEEVRKCIRTEMERQGIGQVSNNFVNAALEEIEFNADGLSMSGCKGVADVVAFLKYKFHEEL